MKQNTTQIEKLAAAYLAAKGKKQSDIALALGVSQTVVSRMLKETKGTYWRESFEFIEGKVDTATMHSVLHRIGENKLDDALRETVKERTKGISRGPVLKVFSGGPKNAKFEDRIAEFTRNAAPFVREIMMGASTCGLTWGGTLWHLVNAFRGLQTTTEPWIPKRNIECIPLTGEPLGDTPTSFSSSSLAAELGRIANGDGYHAKSIAMVPAFIPDGFTEAQLRGVWKLIDLVPSYGEIFSVRGGSRGKKKQRLSENLDMILTSVGPTDKVFGWGSSRLFKNGKVSIEKLQSLIVGEMGGVCFARPNLTAAEKLELKSVEARWTGLNRATLEACWSAAESDSSKPGVVVVCSGEKRAPFIYEALDVINYLVVDEALASELGRIIDHKAASLRADAHKNLSSGTPVAKPGPRTP